MIQQITHFPSTPAQGGPHIWSLMAGQGRRKYSLKVTQNPLRARMCGFGDKDRRPLAPAAVAKMIVTTEDGTLVDEKDVDCSFFLCTVDLWSADGQQEMNLVLHPSSSDRYVPPNSSKSGPNASNATSTSSSGRRKASASSQQRSATGRHTPVARRTPAPSPSRANEPSTSEATSPVSPESPFPYPPTPASADTNITPAYPSVTRAASGSDAPTWGYSIERNAPYPSLPSINSFSHGSSEAWRHPPSHQPQDGEPELAPYRPWTAERAFYNESSPTDERDMSWPASPATRVSGIAKEVPAEAGTSFIPAPQQCKTDAQQPFPPLPKHTYTRTLVGPLSANATLLQDEHRKPGIFFLFQDLSVRTEGTFRLRMRLLNVGVPPAPDYGATRAHEDVSPVLAQTFTEPFTVYSAKRFPGVPDTTALSIAFGNQGQKLPLRNRHGSKRPRRGHNSGSDDDSDGD